LSGVVPFPVILLMGPTAAGKTDLALALAERLPVDIVSVDSAMVYRRMDIGTGKPPPEVLARHPHRLVNIREPYEPYSAAEFQADAREAVETIWAAGRIPLLVGGTMLYFRALTEGLSRLPAGDPTLRAELEADLARRGSVALHADLARLDPVSARRIHPHDPQRILRALEVCRLTGRAYSSLLGERHGALEGPCLKLALAPAERARLHRRIERRFDTMLAAGLVDEVAALRADPRIHAELPSMRSVGYRQVWRYLEGEGDWDALRQRGWAATRQLAKRQFTWLRRERGLHWLDADTAPEVLSVSVERLLEDTRAWWRPESEI